MASTPSIEEMNKIALKHLDYGFQIVKITPEAITLTKDGTEYIYRGGAIRYPNNSLTPQVDELYGPKLLDDAKSLAEKLVGEYGANPDAKLWHSKSGSFNVTKCFSCQSIVDDISIYMRVNPLEGRLTDCNPYSMEDKNTAARELVKFAKRFEVIERRLAESEAQKAVIEAKLAETEASLKKEIEELRAAIGKN